MEHSAPTDNPASPATKTEPNLFVRVHQVEDQLRRIRSSLKEQIEVNRLHYEAICQLDTARSGSLYNEPPTPGPIYANATDEPMSFQSLGQTATDVSAAHAKGRFCHQLFQKFMDLTSIQLSEQAQSDGSIAHNAFQSELRYPNLMTPTTDSIIGDTQDPAILMILNDGITTKQLMLDLWSQFDHSIRTVTNVQNQILAEVKSLKSKLPTSNTIIRYLRKK